MDPLLHQRYARCLEFRDILLQRASEKADGLDKVIEDSYDELQNIFSMPTSDHFHSRTSRLNVLLDIIETYDRYMNTTLN